ncbi:MAG: leucine-rich repeat domain-containing protein [Rhodococcus sp. (in: high G+C Gram-positive bacteria)]|uniref:leucine-rich repeat domain-containing protein n=1 Tax=Rhodococcus sp. TaxID=1831 RepID=UPI003BB654C3
MTISTATTRFAGLPVQQFTTDTDTPADPAATAWKIATDWDGGDERFVADLTALTETEWAGQVTTLLLGQWSDASDPLPTEQVVPLLAALPALTALFVGDMTFDESEISWIDWADLGAVLAATPNLETVQLRGGCTPMTGDDVVLTPPSLPRLRSLTVESGGLLPAYLTALLGADLPVLERLEVWLGTENYGGVDTVEPLAALLTGDLFPNVTSLGLRNAEIADEIAVALADAPILTRITDLDLSLGTLTDVGVDALAAGDLGAVTTLILDHHYASDAALDRLRAAHPQITISAEDRQEADRDDWRYTAVSE